MKDLSASRTALVTAMMRSLHSRADPLPLIADPWGERLVPEAAKQAMRNGMPPADGSPLDARLRAHPAYSNVITRSRFAEDALAAAVARGVRQTVLIGAGFDSYALRRPPAAKDVAVFEIDHPATQGLKRQRLADCGITVPEPVHFLAADLSRESLGEVLAGSPFRRNEPAFFSWLGVTMYLADASIDRALQSMGAFAEGTEVVLTFLEPRDEPLAPAVPPPDRLAARVAAAGERFVSYLSPAAVETKLRQAGFTTVQFLTSDEAKARYFSPQSADLPPPSRTGLACATR